MRPNTAIQEADWRDGFLFVGNQLFLDFLNTRPVQNGEVKELLPDFTALLRWFQAAGLLHPREATRLEKECGQSDRAQRTLAALRQMRERLRKEVLSWEDGTQVHHAVIAELNRLMAKHPMLTELKSTASGLVNELRFETRGPEDLFAPLASAAAALFVSADRTRVRKCGSCVLHFYDTSKKGTRRWCSMRLCGNRLKVAAYARRNRSR